MGRVEEFTQNEKHFVYIDLSGIKTDSDFIEVINSSKPVIASSPEHSLFTITNIAGIRVDTNSKGIIAKYLEHNRPYVKCGAVFGTDGIKNMLLKTVMKLSGRSNIQFCFSKEQAIKWLLQQE